MALTLADAFVRIRPNTDGFSSDLHSRTTIAARSAGKESGKRFGGSFKSSLTGTLTGISGLFATLGVARFLKGVFTEAREALQIQRITAAAIKSTGGAAKVSARDIESLADKLSLMSGIDDEVIQSGENLLLRFTKVHNEVGRGNDIFNRATAIALDLSVALGKDLGPSTIMVGKALNDPVKGLGALTKAGVQFTDEQKKQIKTMVDSGNIMGAQKLILGQLEKRFRGTAAAAADPAAKAKVAWQNFQEELGKRAMPTISKLLTMLTGMLPRVLGIVTAIGNFIANNKELVVIAGIAIAAIKGMSIAFAILNAVMHANPVMLVVDAIVVLIAALVLAYKHSATFRRIVQETWQVIAAVVAFAWNNVIRPVIFAEIFYWRVLGQVALWLWQHAVYPAWVAISNIVAFAWNNVIKPVTAGIIFAWRNVLGPVALWLWQHAIYPAWAGIVSVIRTAYVVIRAIINAIAFTIRNVVAPVVLWLWQHVFYPAWVGIYNVVRTAWTIIRPILYAIWWTIKNIVAPIIVWLWTRIVGPAWAGIRAAFWFGWSVISRVFNAIRAIIVNVVAPAMSWLWTHVIGPVWAAIRAAFWFGWSVVSRVFNAVNAIIVNVVAPAFRWLHDKIIAPIWKRISDLITFFWNNGIRPILVGLANFITDFVAPRFKKGVDKLGAIFDGIKRLFKLPVNWVIRWVINKGIIGTFNNIKGWLHIGGDNIPNVPELARGGVIPGRDTGKDEVYAKLRYGEGVAVPELVNQIGRSRFLEWNKLASRRQPIPGFNMGGILTRSEIATVAARAGLKGNARDVAVAVALAESGGNTWAHAVGNGGDAYGLWQINMLGSMGPERRRRFGLSSNNALWNPQTNANIMAVMSGGGLHWGDWQAFTNGSYKKFLNGASPPGDQGIFDLFSQFTGEALKFVTNPRGYVLGKLAGALSGIQSRWDDSMLGRILKGLGNRVKDLLVDKAASLVSDLVGSGDMGPGSGLSGSIAMGWQRQWGLVHKRFPWAQLFSSKRAGPPSESYHNSGRAIDITPNMAIFNWLVANFGKKAREIIYSPAGNRQIWNGHPHFFTGPRAGPGTHVDHIHWAMSRGGIVDRRLYYGVYDRGGYLMPGWNMAYNGLGRPEPVGDTARGTTITIGPVAIRDEVDIDMLARRLNFEIGEF